MYIVHLQGYHLTAYREWEGRLVKACAGPVNHPYIMFKWGAWIVDNNGKKLCLLWDELEELKDD